MNRSLAILLALSVGLPSLLKGAEPVFGLMIQPPEEDWVSKISEDLARPDLHTARERSRTPRVEEGPAAPRARHRVRPRSASSDDLLAALTNTRDLGPVLAGFDPPAPLEERARGHHRVERLDRHPYLAVDGRHGFRQGGHQGTRVGQGGRLELAPGATQGAFVSKAFRIGEGANHLQPGLVGDRGAQVFVRAYRRPGGQPSRWHRVDRERAVRLQAMAVVLQVLVLLVATASNQNPGLGRVTFTPGIYGIPRGGFQGASGGPRYPPPYSQGSFGRTNFPPRSPTWYPGSNQRQQAAPPPSQAPRLPPMSGDLRIVSRQEWGAADPNGSPGSHTPSSITIHHTEGGYSGPSTLQSVQRLHQGSRGWKDIGYHFLIAPDGTIYEGRPLGQVGSHSPPNSGRVGVCLIGNFKQERPSQAALGSTQKLIQALVQRTGIQRGALHGHKDQRSTDCPGTHLYPYVPQLRSSM